MNFDQTSEFAKELKRFSKKWRSIYSDLELLQQALRTLYLGSNGIAADHIRESFFATKKGAVLRVLPGGCEVVKVRMDSVDINKDMLRVVYIRDAKSILLVELYAKNDKSREDLTRTQKYLKLIKPHS